ncbi:MAG TPA: hypothetical protein VGW34_05205 [Allosphingosinicella sp.]|nr:hypothetical protein [Allosphingosinicella sp.]
MARLLPLPPAAFVAAACAATAPAQPSPDPATTWVEQATAHYYNAPLRLAWQRPQGDWVDAAGERHGSRPFAAARLDREGAHDIDVTDLVRGHGADFLIVGRLADVASREAPAGRPLLIVERGGQALGYEALADVGLDPTSHASRPAAPSLKLADGLLVRFAQPADPGIRRAVLRLTVTKLWSGEAVPTRVFRPDPRPAPRALPDVPLGSEADVVLRVAGPGWRKGRGWARSAAHARLAPDGSLAAWIPPGGDTALSAIYPIPPATRRELMCVRVEMTVHRDWTAPWGGKFPGLANTGQGDGAQEQAGWGGRGADGTRWSARANRYGHEPGHPFADDWLALGTYAYRVNAETGHGDAHPLALPVPKGRRFAYDQCVGLNKPGRADGFVAYWINGRPAGGLDGIVWRSHAGPDTLPSEIWADVYEGGTGYGAVPHGKHSVTLHALTLSTRRLPL